MNKLRPQQVKLFLVLFTWISYFSLSSCGQTQALGKEAQLDSILQHFQTAGQFNGSALVVHDGRIILNKGYGFSNKLGGIQNAPQTFYQIGSITKQFTATVILKLLEDGKLNTEDNIGKYFPALKNSEKITVHHLLSHRSGLFNYTNDTSLWYSTMSEKKLVDFLNSKSMNFEPGKKFEYCNSGYWLLGKIIEKLTGKKYEEAVQEWIFHPLKMDQSGFDFNALRSPQKSTGYYDAAGELQARILDSTMAYAAGAIYSTTGDMLKWAEAMSKRAILKPSSWDLMMTNHGSGYGYGVVTDNLYGTKNIWHNGGIDGYLSCYFNLLDKKIVIIILSNTMQSTPEQLSKTLASALLEKPYKLPDIRKETKLPVERLQQYIGVYKLLPRFSITITVEGEKLMAQATGQENYQVYPERQDFFFYKVVDAQIEFERDAAGKVIALTLHQNGQKQKGNKNEQEK